jgi:redox-sensitive bicupin YhaK (pirin superfamily)
MAQTVFHSAKERGHADHGWLKAWHSFSFASWYHPEKTNFGALRVLNDDTIAGGKGFGMHPHHDMEIITIPTSGALAHKDSMGHSAVIQAGDVQVMSAGKGIFHSEMNHSETEEVKLFQIWVFPDTQSVEPRYDQQSIDFSKMQNRWVQIIKPRDYEGDGIWIHQHAWFNIADVQKGSNISYLLHGEMQGVYAFLMSGEGEILGHHMNARDAIGVYDTPSINFSATEDSRILLMEVPLQF